MPEKLKVAAYARVSMESPQMNHSLNAQMEHYRKLIAAQPDWEFAGVYADLGLSGTGTGKRKKFQRLLSDCEAGKIHRILVKSVSRFARNTVDLLEVTRFLKKRQISVWFEEQEMDSLSEEGEFLLTLAASIAQAESESLSENARWAIRKRFQNGQGNTRKRTFGYRWENKKLVVVPEEARAVKQIFSDFLAGKSHSRTAEELNRAGVRSINGRPISVSGISFILRNVTYTGDLLLQKNFIRDPFSKKKVLNTGELPQYLVENDHEAIIDKETFQKVQEKLAENKKQGKFPYNRTGAAYPFTGKIICGRCGRHYTRQLWNAGSNRKRPTWVCTGKKQGKTVWCESKNLSEEQLMEASAAALGREKFSADLFAEKIEAITVGKNGELFFKFDRNK